MQIETNWRADGSRYIYTMDDRGQWLARQWFNTNGTCLELVIYDHDDLQRTTGWIVYDGAGNVVSRTENFYGRHDHESEVREYNGMSTLRRRTEYMLNEEGRVVEERNFDSNNIQRSRGVPVFDETGFIETKYYDMKGNEIDCAAA